MDFLRRVHDERTVGDDRLVDRLTSYDQQLRVLFCLHDDAIAAALEQRRRLDGAAAHDDVLCLDLEPLGRPVRSRSTASIWSISDAGRIRTPAGTAVITRPPARRFRLSTAFSAIASEIAAGSCSIAIGIGITDKAPGSVGGLQLVVSDADAARAELVERGVEVSDVQDYPWGRFVFFSDPDGNGWAVQQIPPRP